MELVCADPTEMSTDAEQLTLTKEAKDRLAFTGVCQICLIQARATRRPCKCQILLCQNCLRSHLATQVSQGKAYILCPGSDCNRVFSDYFMTKNLPTDMLLKYHKILVDTRNSSTLKTCPGCSVVTKVDEVDLKKGKAGKKGLQVTCTSCALCWCFTCQAPWHEGLSCKEHRREDKEFKAWTKLEDATESMKKPNAQKCPKCKIYIQSTSTCDWIRCSRCSTVFCYDCGQLYFSSRTGEASCLDSYFMNKIVGTHKSRFSVRGCPKKFLPNSSVCRTVMRASLLGGKLVLGLFLLPVALLLDCITRPCQ